MGSLKGKTVNKAGEHVEINISEIPSRIEEQISEITLCGDMMKVNRIPFLVMISRVLKFGTVEVLQGEKGKHLLPA